MSGELVVEMADASVRLGDGRTILGPLSLQIRSGEHWVVLGANGSGKSTLLDLVGARRHPSHGTVAILGNELGRVDVRELRKQIGVVSQLVASQIPASLTAIEVVLAGLRSQLVPWYDTFTQDDFDTATLLLVECGCEHVVEQLLTRCSQGEKQRVLLARALASKPRLLLLDEPCSGLDLPGREMLLDIIREQTKRVDASILVTHHLEEIPSSTTHALLLRDAEPVSQGVIDAALTSSNLRATFDLKIDAKRNGDRWMSVLT